MLWKLIYNLMDDTDFILNVIVKRHKKRLESKKKLQYLHRPILQYGVMIYLCTVYLLYMGINKSANTRIPVQYYVQQRRCNV